MNKNTVKPFCGICGRTKKGLGFNNVDKNIWYHDSPHDCIIFLKEEIRKLEKQNEILKCNNISLIHYE